MDSATQPKRTWHAGMAIRITALALASAAFTALAGNAAIGTESDLLVYSMLPRMDAVATTAPEGL